MSPRPRLAFYGDDVTGSTDALAQCHRAGLRGTLVFSWAGRVAASPAPVGDVIGIAGTARALSTDAMDAEVGPALEALRATGAGFVQYKMCSTADSAPHRGSLGRAAEIGRDVFGAAPVPLLAAQPDFGRHTVFGHHFATDDDGHVHRLDRQPTMSRHPVTPMTESDLRRHLARQTRLPVASLDVSAYELPFAQARSRYEAVLAAAPGLVVLDALTAAHARYAARLVLTTETTGTIGTTGAADPARFAIGSGGLTLAVAQVLAGAPATRPYSAPSPARTLVVSGSRAPRTAAQIAHARDRGWRTVEVPADPRRGCDTTPAALARLRDAVREALDGQAPGAMVHAGPNSGTDPGDTLGDALAHAARTAVTDAGATRLVVAGGDTAGRVLRRLDARTAEIDTLLAPGAALCRLTFADPALNGVTALLKGGQAGPVDLFERAAGRTGAVPTATAPREPAP
ncbi:four-carbon acid sugar kinase family protein [Streptomyces longispororuber]|uniref:four-carbon acid sugar kinase family protein n=1 Tax=Streptomyces longispororuber TaxID=68230 RepID=UPI00210E2B06|nr:four-carbon acid sugar kinase family protein [Streptomyces longispororuber]MCQ4209550.1 four-carbon acid sugar kinase family protein [Streptomyces longispororuber]